MHYLFGDQIGSTSLVVDGAGRVVSEVRYRPWGEVRYNPGALPTRYTYTGQYSHLAEFGLYFYNARWYSPTLGRFTQPDSLIPVQSQSVQAWDRYAYVNNNPLRYVDPSGHGCEEIPEGSYARHQCERTQANRTIEDRLADVGVTLDGEMEGWTYEHKYAVWAAVSAVGQAFAQTRGRGETAAEAFRAVYGWVTF